MIASPVAPLCSTTSGDAPYITLIKAWRHGETNGNKKALLTGGGPDDPQGMTALNEEGYRQAATLGKLVLESGPLDVVYTSDLSRASETARAVLESFHASGSPVEVRISMALREILHGKFELTDSRVRNEAAISKFTEMFSADERHETSAEVLSDTHRFWKVHPLVENHEIVPCDVVNVPEYIQNGESRPETPYQLWHRVYNEFIRIGRENPGKTVGVSTHGAVLATLIDGLAQNPRGRYLPPHFIGKDIKNGDEVLIRAAAKVENCALICFKYDSRDGSLELIAPN